LWLEGVGFKFSKIGDGITEELSIQSSRFGEKFCINMYVSFHFQQPAEGNSPDDNFGSTDKFWDRLTPSDERDYWWSFPESEDEVKVAALFENIIAVFKDQGSKYFGRYSNWKDTFTGIKVDDIEANRFHKLLPIPETRQALFLARLHHHLGNSEQVKKFSTYGLERVNGLDGTKGSALIPIFRRLIAVNS